MHFNVLHGSHKNKTGETIYMYVYCLDKSIWEKCKKEIKYILISDFRETWSCWSKIYFLDLKSSFTEDAIWDF